MAYLINRWSGPEITSVEDGTVNETLDIKLIGKNYAGYGEIQNENMVNILENFAGPYPPSKAISGQVWYDTVNKRLKFHTGDVASGAKLWKAAGGVEYSATEPLVPSAGDMWLDTTKSQLKVRTATNTWLTIGPQSAGSATTQMVSKDVKGFPATGGSQVYFPIIAGTVNDEVVYIIAKDEFTLDQSDPASVITGFTLIKKGLTLAYSDSNGQSSTTAHRFWGTASYATKAFNSDNLGGFPSSEFIRENAASFNSIVSFKDVGFTVGDDADLKISVESGSDPVIENQLGSRILFRVISNNMAMTPVSINQTGLTPGANNLFNLGTSNVRWGTVYATTFNGTATQADKLNVNGVYVSPTTTSDPDSIAARDSSGRISATSFIGGSAEKADSLQVGSNYFTASISSASSTVAVRDTDGSIAATSFKGNATTATTATIANTATTATTAAQANSLQVGSVYRIASASSSANTIAVRDGSGGITATSFYGNATTATTATTANTATTADSAEKLRVSTLENPVHATAAAESNTIAARDGNGNLTAGIFNGTATQARYADLAEKYLTDKEYVPGTVVSVGGEKEVTACSLGQRALGAVSTNPAYMMNSDLEGGTYIALKGRVPVKVVGPVRKGQRLVAGENGTAIGATGAHVDVFAISLEDNQDVAVKLIECVIL